MEEKQKNNSAMGAGSLTLGILSIVFNLFWYITLPTGILAIILGHKASKKIGSKTGKAGVVTGIVGLSLFAFAYIGILCIYILENVL